MIQVSKSIQGQRGSHGFLAVASILFPLSWGCLQNVVNPEYHLCCLTGLHEDLPLHAEALCDPQLLHAPHLPLCHVQTHGAFAKNMLGLELADQLSRVIPSVLSNDGGQLSESICKAGHSSGLLARGNSGQLIHSPCHQQLRAAAPIEGPWLLHSGSENAQGVMKTPLRFSDDLLRCSSEDNAASLTERDSTELQ